MAAAPGTTTHSWRYERNYKWVWFSHSLLPPADSTFPSTLYSCLRFCSPSILSTIASSHCGGSSRLRLRDAVGCWGGVATLSGGARNFCLGGLSPFPPNGGSVCPMIREWPYLRNEWSDTLHVSSRVGFSGSRYFGLYQIQDGGQLPSWMPYLRKWVMLSTSCSC